MTEYRQQILERIKTILTEIEFNNYEKDPAKQLSISVICNNNGTGGAILSALTEVGYITKSDKKSHCYAGNRATPGLEILVYEAYSRIGKENNKKNAEKKLAELNSFIVNQPKTDQQPEKENPVEGIQLELKPVKATMDDLLAALKENTEMLKNLWIFSAPKLKPLNGTVPKNDFEYHENGQEKV